WWRWFDGAAWTAHTHPMSQPPFGFGPAPQQRDRALEMVLPINRLPLAIVAGYLGIFSLLVFPGPIAVFVSVIAIRQLGSKPDVAGRGRAWFGLIAGALASVILVSIIANSLNH
ncbi:MAG TPA: hypothetical protein VGD55_11755, partial [Acidothermaceae bacterium]